MAANIAPFLVSAMLLRRRAPAADAHSPDERYRPATKPNPFDVVADARSWSLPIDTERLAGALDIVIEEDALPDGVYATLAKDCYRWARDDYRWRIRLAPDLEPHLRRFAIAVLVGHRTFNRSQISRTLAVGNGFRQVAEASRRFAFFRCKSAQATLSDKDQNYALRFAVNTVMPAGRVVDRVRAGQDAETLARAFGVATGAMQARIRDITERTKMMKAFLARK